MVDQTHRRTGAPAARAIPAQWTPPPPGSPTRPPAVTSPPPAAQAPPKAGPTRTGSTRATGRHAATGPADPSRDPLPGALPQPAAPAVRRWANWLLLIPMVLPLLSPLYNRRDPYLWGVPFFYWFQIACALVTCAMVMLVYQLTKGRR